MIINLLVARKKMKLSQAEVARRVGIARETYFRVENGLQMPKADVAQRIIALLQVESDIFFKPYSA